MATTYGNTVNGRWCAYMNWSTSSNNTQTTLTVECCLQVNNYSVSYNNVTGDVSIDFSVNKSAQKSINKSYGAGTTYYSFCSASKTFTRGKSASDKAFSAGVTFGAGSSNWAGSSRAYGTLTVQPKPSYKVSYNANGGSGAPGAQTKWYGENLTLSSTKPTRTGYKFLRWSATINSGTVNFNPGATYTYNSAATLYAAWQANTYTVSFNANGGSGAPGAQTKTYGQTLYLSSTRPTRTNYNFKGWATSASATTAQYQPGGAFTTNAATTLYAVWELAYIKPRITNLAANRCNSAGTYADDGTYAKVTFSWATDRSVSGIKIVCNGVTTNVTGSGTSGSVNQVVGAGALSTENQYTVTVTVSDSGGSTPQNTVVAPLAYIMDFSPQGGVGIGRPAPNAKRFNVATDMAFQGAMRGFAETAAPHVDSTWRYKILARSTIVNSESGNSNDHIHVWGVLGGWTAGSKGPIDLYVPTRNGSATTIVLSTFSPVLFANDSGRLIVRLGNDGYVYVIIAVQNYYSYSLYVDCGDQNEIVDSDWSTNTGVSGTDWFNSATVKTDQFGGYPLKVEKLNGYYGFALPDKTRSNWFRTTGNGLIPYQAGQPSVSSLGTDTWEFKNGYIRNLYSNTLTWDATGGLKGRVYKRLWSGTCNTGSSITISELPYYNVFYAIFGTSAYSREGAYCYRKNDSGGNYIMGFGGNGWGGLVCSAIAITITSSTTIRLEDAATTAFSYTTGSTLKGAGRGYLKELYGIL